MEQALETDVQWGTAARNLDGAATTLLGVEQAANMATGNAIR